MKKNSILVMAAGLVLLAAAAAKVGIVGLLHNLLTGWIALPILVAIGLARLALQTASWSKSLQIDGIRVRTTDLIGARLASKGMGYLSVLGPAVAEPMRIKLLGENAGKATAATLIDTGVYWFSSGITAIAASLCAIHAMSGGKHLGAMLVAASMTAVGLALIARPNPLLPSLIRALGTRCPAMLKKAESVELAIRAFQKSHPEAIRSMLLMGLLAQVFMVAEIATVILVLKLPFHTETILALEAANRLVRTMGAWLPARIGADETGMAAAFLMLGLPSASGLTLALARRVRDLMEVFAGLGWLAWTSRQRVAIAA